MDDMPAPLFPLFCPCVMAFLQFLVCKRKLESKKEALLILSKELDTCQQERDQYKLMANQLRERHQGLKKKYRELIVSGSMLFCPCAQFGYWCPPHEAVMFNSMLIV